jgi:Acyl-CoA dehydrogenase, C-terminal domain
LESDELTLLDSTISALVDDADGNALTNALDAFGWIDILRTDPETAVRSLFGAQGRAVAWSSALHDLLGLRLAELNGRTSSAKATVIVPLPKAGAFNTVGGRGMQIEGLLLGARPDLEWLVAACSDAEGTVTVFEFRASEAALEPALGLDPAIHAQRVSTTTNGAAVVASGNEASAWWAASGAIARRALSHSLCGLLTTMLGLARDHAVERRQFGRQIGSFQAVRHKLAEAHVAIEGAIAATDMAWDNDEEALASMTAKLIVSRARALVTAHTQQVLAGIGFTAEHSYHRAMKRAVVLDRVFGSGDQLAALVGHELVARRRTPRLVEL